MPCLLHFWEPLTNVTSAASQWDPADSALLSQPLFPKLVLGNPSEHRLY